MTAFGKRPDGPGGRRAVSRSPVLMSAALHTVGASHGVSVLDVSQLGLQLRSRLPLRVGQEIWLKLPHQDVFGTIAWVEQDLYGLQFDAPLGEAEAAALQAKGKAVIVPHLTREQQEAALDWQTDIIR
jgi:hypothetical protein